MLLLLRAAHIVTECLADQHDAGGRVIVVWCGVGRSLKTGRNSPRFYRAGIDCWMVETDNEIK